MCVCVHVDFLEFSTQMIMPSANGDSFISSCLHFFFFFFGCAGSSLRYVGFFSCSTQASSPHSMWALSFRTRDRTCVPYMARWILNHWTTREVPVSSFLIWMYYYYLGTPTSKCLKGPGCGHCGERGPMSITGGCRHWLCKPPSSDC